MINFLKTLLYTSAIMLWMIGSFIFSIGISVRLHSVYDQELVGITGFFMLGIIVPISIALIVEYKSRKYYKEAFELLKAVYYDKKPIN